MLFMVYYVIAYYTFAKGDPSVMAKQSRKKRSPGRRILLLLLLVLLAAGFFRWSNHSLQVERFTFTSPRLPQGFAGCTIVELSDLHGAQFGEGNQDLIDEIRELSPDYIFLTGDLLDRFRETPHSYAVDLGSALAAIAPTYFVTGNHEWALPHVPDLKEGLEAAGVTVLDNRFVTLERGGDSIILAGIDDPNGYADQKTPEELAEEVKAAAEDPFWILLAHCNDHFLRQYSLLGADLVISGHGHGGMIRLPFTDGLISTDRTLFPSYTAGFYTENNSTAFISRGLGNSGPSFRLFNRPQIAVLTLERG